MIFQGGYYRDILNEYVAKKDSPCLQDVQNYEKKSQRLVSKFRKEVSTYETSENIQF